MEQRNLLEKGIEVLDLLCRKKTSLSFFEIKKEVSIPKTTLYRILKTLIRKNFIEYDENEKRYKLGYGILYLTRGVLSRLPLREISSPYLRKLCNETEETVELIIPDGDAILYIDKVESLNSIRLVAQIGSKYKTIHASAPGKILLAFESEVYKRFFKKKRFEKLTENTITDKDVLKAEIEKIKLRGWAYDNGEARIDVKRIAAPILNYGDKLVGIICIAGPSYRIKNKEIKVFGKKVKKVAEEISKKFGYQKGGENG